MLHSDFSHLMAADDPRSVADLIAANDALRGILDGMARANRPVPADLRAAAQAIEAELFEAQFDNLPV